MNKKRISGIAVLMTFVLAGLISMQVYWIKNAIQLREQQFNTSVSQALNSAARQIEKQDALSFFSSNLNWMQRHISNSGGNSGFSSFNSNDSIEKIGVEIIEENGHVHIKTKKITEKKREKRSVEKEEKIIFNKVESTPITNDTEDYIQEQAAEPVDLLPGISVEVDTTVELDTTLGQLYLNTSISVKVNDSVQTIKVRGTTPSSLKKSIDKHLKTFETKKSIVNDMFFDFYNQGRRTGDRIDTSNLVNVLKQEFSNRGINTAFEYHLTSLYGKTVLASNNFKPKVGNRGFKVALFANDLFSEPNYLTVYFPKQNAYIIQSLGLMSISSMLLILIIIFCFVYIIHIIFRQKKLSDMKTDFINNMTHELKTPIATISLASEMLGNDEIASNKEKRGRFANIINEENKRLGGQVERVLQMAVLDKGDIQLKKEEIDVHNLISKVIDQQALQLEEKGGEISTKLEAKNPIVNVDKIHFTNILYNLIDNAIKYAKEKPEITINTIDAPLGIKVLVSDKGIGMSKDTQKRVFEKFYRVSTGNIHNVKGFGLGLSYVKLMVDAHGGAVSLNSEPGKGSTFEIFMPYI